MFGGGAAAATPQRFFFFQVEKNILLSRIWLSI